MPHAMYSFGETDLPVWPTCVEYGYQPASTTARVAPTAPPSAAANSSSLVQPPGEPSLRLLDQRCERREVRERRLEALDFRAPARLHRVERAGADQSEPRPALPANV